MRKKSLILLVALLVAAGMMATMAFTDGYVHSIGYVKVSASDEALLSVIPADTSLVGYKDVTAKIEAGAVLFQFGKSGLGTFPGMQPGSRYSWDALISLHNKSLDNIEYHFGITSGPLANCLTITDKTTGEVVFAPGANEGYFRLNSNVTEVYRFDIVIPHGYALNLSAVEENIVIDTRAIGQAGV